MCGDRLAVLGQIVTWTDDEVIKGIPGIKITRMRLTVESAASAGSFVHLYNLTINTRFFITRFDVIGNRRGINVMSQGL